MLDLREVPKNFLPMLLPGLEVALQSTVEEINQVLEAIGANGRYTVHKPRDSSAAPAAIDAPTPEAPPVKKRRRKLSAAGRANIVRALKKRWKAKKRANVKVMPSKVARKMEETPSVRSAMGHSKNGTRNAVREEIVAYARRHRGRFDTEAFKTSFPKLQLRGLGNLVAKGVLAKVAGESKVYQVQGA